MPVCRPSKLVVCSHSPPCLFIRHKILTWSVGVLPDVGNGRIEGCTVESVEHFYESESNGYGYPQQYPLRNCRTRETVWLNTNPSPQCEQNELAYGDGELCRYRFDRPIENDCRLERPFVHGQAYNDQQDSHQSTKRHGHSPVSVLRGCLGMIDNKCCRDL